LTDLHTVQIVSGGLFSALLAISWVTAQSHRSGIVSRPPLLQRPARLGSSTPATRGQRANDNLRPICHDNEPPCTMPETSQPSWRSIDPPPVKWSAVMIRKRRIENGQQATEAGRDCLEVAAG